jgi:hypothetical protein
MKWLLLSVTFRLGDSESNMITENQQSELENAAYQYEHGSFGHPEFEEVMQQVFGNNRTGADATKWRCYWNELTDYCEKMEENDLTAEKPMAC